MFRNHLQFGPTLYLLDLLEDLKFLDSDKVGQNFQKIEEILAERKDNLLIDLTQSPQMVQNVKENLALVCLAFQNLEGSSRRLPLLDDGFL